jgi:hypothetical protein
MKDAGAEGGDPTTCTAVLLSVPRQVAERLESFLTANGIPCRIQLNAEMTPERLAEEYLRGSPEASRVLDVPLLGPLLRGRLAEDLKAEIQVVSSDIPPVWDVLVRPEDLPGAADDAIGAPDAPRLNVPPSAADARPAAPAPESTSPTVVCELPWDEAWALIERLNAAGIPAAVMAAEAPDRDRPMQARIVPVGVRPEDVERAAAFIG